MVKASEYKQQYMVGTCCQDHAGNMWRTAASMCRGWGIKEYTFRTRMQDGWSLASALTVGSTVTPDEGDAILVFGEYYSNYKEISDKFSIEHTMILRHSGDVEAYIKSFRFYDCGDDLRPTMVTAADTGSVHVNTISNRLNSGWSVEDAVSVPVKDSNNGKPCKDHLGHDYKSLTEMLLHYKLTFRVYYYRKGKGWSLEKILTTPAKRYNTKINKLAILEAGARKIV